MNGCHNRPPLGMLRSAQNGTHERTVLGLGGAPLRVVQPNMMNIPHAMTRDCQYTHSTAGRTDAGCVGCRWRAP